MFYERSLTFIIVVLALSCAEGRGAPAADSDVLLHRAEGEPPVGRPVTGRVDGAAVVQEGRGVFSSPCCADHEFHSTPSPLSYRRGLRQTPGARPVEAWPVAVNGAEVIEAAHELEAQKNVAPIDRDSEMVLFESDGTVDIFGDEPAPQREFQAGPDREDGSSTEPGPLPASAALVLTSPRLANSSTLAPGRAAHPATESHRNATARHGVSQDLADAIRASEGDRSSPSGAAEARKGGDPESPASPEEGEQDKDTNLTAIFAGTVGGVVGVVVASVIPLVSILVRRHRRRKALAASGEAGEGGFKAGSPWPKGDASPPPPAPSCLDLCHACSPGPASGSPSPGPLLSTRRVGECNSTSEPSPGGSLAAEAAQAASAAGASSAGSEPRGRTPELLRRAGDEAVPAGPGSSSGREAQNARPDSPWRHAPPPWSDGRVSAEELQIQRRADGSPWVLGSGAYGTVFKALLDGVQPVAVKIIRGMEDERRRSEFLREVALLRSCRDHNIVQFVGACVQGGEAMLVTEFMEFGDLWRAATLRNLRGERVFAWEGRGARAALDIARGLHFLHSRSIAHLDLKSANILLSRDGSAKIADVGMARVLSRSRCVADGGGVGTWAWAAPEVLLGARCTPKADIYSYGVVLWELCTGETPLRGDMRPLRVPEDCPQAVAELQRDCMVHDPTARPSTRELVQRLQREAAAALSQRGSRRRPAGGGVTGLESAREEGAREAEGARGKGEGGKPSAGQAPAPGAAKESVEGDAGPSAPLPSASSPSALSAQRPPPPLGPGDSIVPVSGGFATRAGSSHSPRPPGLGRPPRPDALPCLPRADGGASSDEPLGLRALHARRERLGAARSALASAGGEKGDGAEGAAAVRRDAGETGAPMDRDAGETGSSAEQDTSPTSRRASQVTGSVGEEIGAAHFVPHPQLARVPEGGPPNLSAPSLSETGVSSQDPAARPRERESCSFSAKAATHSPESEAEGDATPGSPEGASRGVDDAMGSPLASAAPSVLLGSSAGAAGD